MTGTSGKAANHWPLLDFLRATAALLVLIGHARDSYFSYTHALAQPDLFLKLFYFVTDSHSAAVVVFFVLSGFLIGGRLTESMRGGSFELPRYLIARFIRIYIVFIPALVITEAIFLLGPLLLSDPGAGHFRPLFSQQQVDFGGVSQAICHLAGLQGFSCTRWEQNPALWSLGYEWALYLFAPAIIGLVMWKASRSLRLMAIALVCAIAVTIGDQTSESGGVVFWFGAWFLGVVAYHILHARPLPLPVGLLGAGLIIAGMAMRQFGTASMLECNMVVVAGTAIAISCRRMAALPLAPRLFTWAAGFSYTLYAIHTPLVFLMVAIFQAMGFPPDKVPPSSVAFLEFAITVIVCLLAAYLVSLVTERRTGHVRAAISKLCPPRWERGGSDARASLHKESSLQTEMNSCKG